MNFVWEEEFAVIRAWAAHQIEVTENADFEGVRILSVDSLGVQNGSDWIAAEATIVSVKRRLFPWKHSEQEYPLPEYVVTFSYDGGGHLCRGKYITTSPEKEGHRFGVFYDPEHPSRNTGLDEPIVLWVKWTAAAIGIALALIAIWLWGDQVWMQS